MTKTELRQQLRQKRRTFSDSQRLIKSKQICKKLEQLDWSNVHSLHCYEPIMKLGEVDIRPFMLSLKRLYPRMQLYTSKSIDDAWEVILYGSSKVVNSPLLDAVIVPMLGFDRNLHRIGYGGGYYDRFLSTQTQAKKIGVCFELGKVTHIPIESHDVPLDLIISEDGIYTSQ